MATHMYFPEVIRDQGRKHELEIEIGRSSFYADKGGDSIYIIANGASVIIDRATAKRFVDAVAAVGAYHRLAD